MPEPVRTPEALRRALENAGELKTVVSCMKTLATLNIRGYERATRALETYAGTIERGLQILLRNRPDDVVLTDQEPTGPEGLLVIGSDQGMCGPFNDRIAGFVAERLRGFPAPAGGRMVFCAGTRAENRLERAGVTVEGRFDLPASVEGITTSVNELLPRISDWRDTRGMDRLDLYYHRRESERLYDPIRTRLLPVEGDWLQELGERPWDGPSLPRFRSDRRDLFTDLMTQYLYLGLYRAFAESLASENAARLQSMAGAEDNVKQQIRQLRDRYHRTRQSLVTEELLDLTSGYAALSGEKDSRRYE